MSREIDGIDHDGQPVAITIAMYQVVDDIILYQSQR